MAIEEQRILIQLLDNRWHKCKPVFECPQHEMLVYLGGGDIYESLYAEVVVVLYPVCFTKQLVFFKVRVKFAVVSENEMCIHQVMHSFDIVPGFHPDHKRLFIKNINPFLRITIIHQEILADKGVPAITLVEVQP